MSEYPKLKVKVFRSPELAWYIGWINEEFDVYDRGTDYVVAEDYDKGHKYSWRHIDKLDCWVQNTAPLQDTPSLPTLREQVLHFYKALFPDSVYDDEYIYERFIHSQPSLPKREGEYTLREAVEFALNIRDLWAADQVGTISADHEGEMQALSKMEEMFKSALLLTPAFCPSPKQEADKTYPIGGYAPGNYHCKCVTCKSHFKGDKRAVQCEPCAEKMIADGQPASELPLGGEQEPDRPVALKKNKEGVLQDYFSPRAQWDENQILSAMQAYADQELSTANATIEVLKESAQGWEAQYHQAEGKIESLKEELSAIKHQYEKEPLAFLLSNALRLLSMEQMISLADSLYERTPAGSGIRAELAKYKDQSPKY